MLRGDNQQDPGMEHFRLIGREALPSVFPTLIEGTRPRTTCHAAHPVMIVPIAPAASRQARFTRRRGPRQAAPRDGPCCWGGKPCRCCRYRGHPPPDAVSIWPLIQLAAGEQSNRAALAMSLGSPSRLSGVCFNMAASVSGVRTFCSAAGVVAAMLNHMTLRAAVSRRP